MDGAIAKLDSFYVFPEVAKRMADSLRARRTRGAYDTYTNAICEPGSRRAGSRQAHARELPRAPDPTAAGHAASAAMNFVAGSRALIVDLRENGGGSPAMVAYVLDARRYPRPALPRREAGLRGQLGKGGCGAGCERVGGRCAHDGAEAHPGFTGLGPSYLWRPASDVCDFDRGSPWRRAKDRYRVSRR